MRQGNSGRWDWGETVVKSQSDFPLTRNTGDCQNLLFVCYYVKYSLPGHAEKNWRLWFRGKRCHDWSKWDQLSRNQELFRAEETWVEVECGQETGVNISVNYAWNLYILTAISFTTSVTQSYSWWQPGEGVKYMRIVCLNSVCDCILKTFYNDTKLLFLTACCICFISKQLGKVSRVKILWYTLLTGMNNRFLMISSDWVLEKFELDPAAAPASIFCTILIQLQLTTNSNLVAQSDD